MPRGRLASRRRTSRAEYERLTARGVAFTQPPMTAGLVVLAVFADTCGNLVQIYQPPDRS